MTIIYSLYLFFFLKAIFRCFIKWAQTVVWDNQKLYETPEKTESMLFFLKGLGPFQFFDSGAFSARKGDNRRLGLSLKSQYFFLFSNSGHKNLERQAIFRKGHNQIRISCDDVADVSVIQTRHHVPPTTLV